MFVGLAKSTLLCFIVIINLIFIFTMMHILSQVTIVRADLFMYLCIKNLHLDPGCSFVDSKSHLNPTVVYASGRSKAVVLMRFLDM